MFLNCSTSLAFGFLFFFELPLLKVLVTFLNLGADLGHFNVVNLVVILLHVAFGTVASLTVALIFTTFSSGLDTDVLSGVGFLIELVSEVLGHDVTAIFVVFFKNDLLELLADSIHNFVEAEVHRLVCKLTDLLIELLINLLSDTGGPGSDLVVSKLDFLIDFFSLFIFLLVFAILPIKLS